jgi:hypothetical protein
MVPKYHPAPLSGGDRKALNKELGKARAMANILATRSAEMRPKGDADDTVVGFVLAKPDRLERFHHENQALSLPYIGVSKIWRQRGIFAGLMEKLTSKGAPLNAIVLHANQFAMADRLMKIGYTKVGSDEKQHDCDGT